MTNTATVIHQLHLLDALTTDFKDERGIRDWPDELTGRLDPDGIMLVSVHFPHNDGPDWRIVGFAKMRETLEPAHVRFTLPGKFSNILQEIEVETP